MDRTNQNTVGVDLTPRSSLLAARAAFTLVELLVVITIIGILAALIVTAAVGALGKGQETRIKAEINQLDSAMMEYKNKVTAFPPNSQTDDADYSTTAETPAAPLSESHVLSNLKKHLSQIAPRSAEPEDLLKRIAGLVTTGERLEGGMSAGEALVFWLSGFSSNPEYPISGDGGPSYNITGESDPDEKRKKDPIEDRNWVFPFEVSRLLPRASDGYFDAADGRFIEYTVTINGVTQTRRINFWQYAPAKSQQPYLYFDTSRHPAYDTTAGVQPARFDPPAAPDVPGSIPLHVHAFKKASESTGTNVPIIQFVNPEKFQIIHSGRDEAWDEEAFERMSPHGIVEANGDPTDVNEYLLFPNGPFIGEIADTIVNFAEQTRIEDAQPQ